MSRVAETGSGDIGINDPLYCTDLCGIQFTTDSDFAVIIFDLVHHAWTGSTTDI